MQCTKATLFNAHTHISRMWTAHFSTAHLKISDPIFIENRFFLLLLFLFVTTIDNHSASICTKWRKRKIGMSWNRTSLPFTHTPHAGIISVKSFCVAGNLFFQNKIKQNNKNHTILPTNNLYGFGFYEVWRMFSLSHLSLSLFLSFDDSFVVFMCFNQINRRLASVSSECILFFLLLSSLLPCKYILYTKSWLKQFG